MKIYVSINGVLRNIIDKFIYHYNEYYLNTETENEEKFIYDIKYPIKNDDLIKYFNFQSVDEFNNFVYIDYALEIFGYANPSYSLVFNDLNKFISDNTEHEITIIGIDEFGKSISASLFFLSKNGFIGKNIKFIFSKDLKDEWKNCDVWITDSEEIIKLTPNNKKSIKFNTNYNSHYNHKLEINKISEINKTWLTYSEKNISSACRQLMKFVKLKRAKMMKSPR